MLGGKVVGASGNGDEGDLAIQRRLDKLPRRGAMTQMQVLRHERDPAAGGNHHLNRILPLAGDDARLEPLDAAAFEQKRTLLAIGPQEDTFMLEVGETHAFLPFEAVTLGKYHDDTFAIESVMPQPPIRGPKSCGHSDIEVAA